MIEVVIHMLFVIILGLTMVAKEPQSKEQPKEETKTEVVK